MVDPRFLRALPTRFARLEAFQRTSHEDRGSGGGRREDGVATGDEALVQRSCASFRTDLGAPRSWRQGLNKKSVCRMASRWVWRRWCGRLGRSSRQRVE